MRRPFIAAVATAALGLALLAGGSGYAAHRALASHAWQEPQDSSAAINDPDFYAWRLFVALNWPADLAARRANPGKRFSDAGPVVWETWANAHDVYLADGADPGAWALGRARLKPLAAGFRNAAEFDSPPIQQQIRLLFPGMKLQFDPLTAQGNANESRMNRDTYEFIRAHELYNLDGQKALAASGAAAIQFGKNAKEVKAQWREIGEADKPRYHWTEIVAADGTRRLYGLTALHIITKDLPNWFWATFEHVDNVRRSGNEPWKLPSRDTFACGREAPDCGRAPKGIGLEGTVWANYRLRGTQTEFTSSSGEPVRLANSEPEEGFQETASCMTCHSRSSVAADGSRLAVFTAGEQGFVGTPDPAWFSPEGKRKFTQLDFIWAMIRAKPKKSPN